MQNYFLPFKINRLIKTALPVLAILFLSACRQNNQPRDKKNQAKLQDTIITERMLNYRSELIKEFNDTIPEDTTNYYHLIFYSAFHNGVAVKFVKKANVYFMCVKTRSTNDSTATDTSYVTTIEKDEWDQLESMVNDFDFWKAKELKKREVLDGYICFLEGNSLANNEKRHKLICRISPEYDKMEALCNYIMDYEERLVFQYKQIHR